MFAVALKLSRVAPIYSPFSGSLFAIDTACNVMGILEADSALTNCRSCRLQITSTAR